MKTEQLRARTATSAAESLPRAAALLRAGGLVAFPTETVYGLGANALDSIAIARIFEAKGRPTFDPLIVHIADRADLPLVLSPAALEDPRITLLADALWPGPLTIVAPAATRIPGLVRSGLPTVGVRLPDHDLARALIRAAGTPIAAPSANLFGQLSPTTAEHVLEQLDGRMDAEALTHLRTAVAGLQIVAEVALSESLDPVVAAAKLFDALHRLDAALRDVTPGKAAILTTPYPEPGLGLAIADRLRRAAAAS